MPDRILKKITKHKKDIVAAFFGLVLILLMGNLSALIDMVHHPEIPYFDDEHVIVGAASAFLTAVAFVILAVLNRKLTLSEAKFRSYVEHAPAAVFVADRTGHLVDSNPAAVKLLGYASETLAGMSVPDIVPAEDREAALGDLRVLLTDGSIEGTYRLKRRDGSLLWASVRGVKVTADRVMAYCHDITEHKRAEDLMTARVRLSELARLGSLQELMQASLNDAEILTNSSIAFFHLVNSDQATILLQAWSANAQKMCSAIGTDQHYPISEAGIWGECLRKKAPVIHNDYAGLPNRKGLPEGHAAVRRLLTVPVVRGNSAVAIIGVGNKPADYTSDDAEVVQELASLVMDLVDRKQAENALRENEGKYRLLFDSNPRPMWVYDFESLRFLAVNEAAIIHYGYSRDEFLCMTIKDIRPGEDIPELLDTLSKIRPGLLQTGVRRHRKKDGTVIWVEITSQDILFGNAHSRLAAVIDVTGRRKAEAALRESEGRLRAIMDNANGVVWVKDLEGRFLIINRYLEEILGRCREQIIGRTVFDLFPRDVAETFSANDRLVIGSDRPMEFEESSLFKDGPHTFLSIKFPLHDSNGRIYALGAICTDISGRKQAEKALHESESNYRALVDNALVGVYRSILDGKFLFVNDAMARIFECETMEEMLSEGVQLRYKNPHDREEFIERLRKHGQIGNYQIEAMTKKGRIISILISAGLNEGVISGMVLDITEHKKLEEQFRQAQKIEAVGLLAGGVAHDFNNILSAIIGFAHVTLMKMRQDDPLRSNLEQILESSDRATVLTKSLLAFSRKQPVNLAVLDLNALVRNLSQFLLRVIREDIMLKIVTEDKPLCVLADKVHLEQVIMNLITNARDALPGVGKIIIDTKGFNLDRKFIEAHGYGKEGDYALFTISDTGTGMDERTRSRIFEPFFTTKEQGKGTGLGLSMVYGTVKRHDGFINVYSEPGKGTTFKIYLPLVKAAAKTVEKREEATAPSRGGTETILVAEDDAALRKLSRIALSTFGYTVIEAVDGADAVLKFKENRDKIRLILLDGIMPRMNGKEAFNAIRAVSSGIKCIFMSGYAEEIFTKDGAPDGQAQFILKPIAPSELLRKIREVLDEETSTIASDV